MRSDCALSAIASAAYVVPMTVPGPKPVTAVPGLSPRLPLIVDGPVLVTVVPARTAKLSAVPSARPVRTTLVFAVSSPLIWSGLRSGRAWSRSAAAPATTGAAIDVPPMRR